LFDLRIKFIDEEALDMGGVRKEFFSIFMKSYIEENNVFQACGIESSQSIDKAITLWFSRSEYSSSNGDEQQEIKRPKTAFISDEYIIGVMLGLAYYHRVLVSLPIPAHMYKLLKGYKVLLLNIFYDLLMLLYTYCANNMFIALFLFVIVVTK
jgi:hypothetical protein